MKSKALPPFDQLLLATLVETGKLLRPVRRKLFANSAFTSAISARRICRTQFTAHNQATSDPSDRLTRMPRLPRLDSLRCDQLPT